MALWRLPALQEIGLSGIPATAPLAPNSSTASVPDQPWASVVGDAQENSGEWAGSEADGREGSAPWRLVQCANAARAQWGEPPVALVDADSSPMTGPHAFPDPHPPFRQCNLLPGNLMEADTRFPTALPRT